MPFEVAAVFIRVLGHRHGKQHVDLKPGLLWIQDGYLPFDEACLLEIPDSPPARGSGHPRDLGQFTLAARGVLLQSNQEANIRSRKFHETNLSVFLFSCTFCFPLFE
jgi:hypothetical protein